jgi:hypothetical protein
VRLPSDVPARALATALAQERLCLPAPRLRVLVAPVLCRPRPFSGRLELAPAARPFAQPPRSLLELDDPRGGVIEEGPVVGHDDDAPASVPHEPLEPFEAVEIEVVRRLVEAEHVEPRQQECGQPRPRGLPSRERFERLVEPSAEAEAGADGGRPRRELVPSQREEPLEGLRVGVRELVLLAEPLGQLVQVGLRCGHAGAPREVGEQRLAGSRVELLGQIADPEIRGIAPDRPTVRPLQPGEGP